MRLRTCAAVVGLLAALAPVAAASTRTEPTGPPAFIVFSGQGNDLEAYDGATGQHQTVIQSAAHAAASPDPDDRGLDINAQLCHHTVDGDTYLIAGEDTSQAGAGGSPGWGWFRIEGDRIGELRAVEEGKLIPTWSHPDGQENYGCGFLDDGRLLLSDVGAQLPNEDASGQLHVWYPNADGGFDDSTHVDPSTSDPIDVTTDIDNRTDGPETGQHYCLIDTTIGTAGGMMIIGGWAYVAANRPGPNGPGGVYRYEIADIPTTAGGCPADNHDVDLVTAGIVTRELWLASDAFVTTPSAVVPTGRELAGNATYYVSSVFTGVIAEYVDIAGHAVHVRNVVEPPGGAPIGQLGEVNVSHLNDGGTPFGMGVGPDGSLWYADLGIQGTGPIDGRGTVQRVLFDSHGNVRDRLIVEGGLDYPEGIGILEVGTREPEDGNGAHHPVKDPGAQSEHPCEWAMYGHGSARDFALPDSCMSAISRTSVATLQPKWKVKTAKTVTASPAVLDGNVYVGDWSATMYKVDAETGAVRWTHATDEASGAAFGPIVSSAAVTDVDDVGRLVIFGAGPKLYALLDGDDASRAWVADLSGGNDYVEIESSPVVRDGVVYVGLGNHNHADTGVPGALLALDAATGDELWRFEPELGADEGCGTVWSSPTINTDDPHQPLVYLATGNCSSAEFSWTPHTEAVTALDAETGKVVWSFQPHLPNRQDWDFGATPNLFSDASGRRVLGIGNKDGVYYALEPRTGALLWSTKVAVPGDVREDFSIGGFLGSTGAYGGTVFGGTAIGGGPYYRALDGATGAIRWQGGQAPSYAASAAVNGIAFSSALDGLLRAYDLETGAVLAAQPLLGPGSSGPAIVGDSVYVGSGTSSSDACAKDLPDEINQQCLALFDEALGGLGGIEAFEVVAPQVYVSPPA